MDKIELKPCPYCGGVAEMHETPHTPNGTDYTPRCKDPSCCGRLSKKYGTREAATMKWNRRATDDDRPRTAD